MCDKIRPDEMFISSGSDDKNNLMSLAKHTEEIHPFSGRFLRDKRIFQIGVLEQWSLPLFQLL